MIHSEAHPLAGQTVKLADSAGPELAGQVYRVEDWWDRASGGSWTMAQGNPAAMKYAMRSGLSGLPLDDEVVYGKVGMYGHLVHISEIVEPES